MNAAETCGDPHLLIVAHHTAAVGYFYLGHPIETREHADRVVALYSEEQIVGLVGIMNRDPGTVSLVFSGLLTWMLGYPEQAARIIDTADDHARRLEHPFDLDWALTVGARLFDYLREPDEFLKRIDEADRLGHENSLPFLTQRRAPSSAGVALIRKGQVAEGMALLERGIAVWEQVGGRAVLPHRKSVLAEGLAHLGDLAGADLVDEGIAQIERPGWEERWYYAEILRVKGWVLSMRGDLAAAERVYVASLDWARHAPR
jgi:hypothetical protein